MPAHWLAPKIIFLRNFRTFRLPAQALPALAAIVSIAKNDQPQTTERIEIEPP